MPLEKTINTKLISKQKIEKQFKEIWKVIIMKSRQEKGPQAGNEDRRNNRTRQNNKRADGKVESNDLRFQTGGSGGI